MWTVKKRQARRPRRVNRRRTRQQTICSLFAVSIGCTGSSNSVKFAEAFSSTSSGASACAHSETALYATVENESRLASNFTAEDPYLSILKAHRNNGQQKNGHDYELNDLSPLHHNDDPEWSLEKYTNGRYAVSIKGPKKKLGATKEPFYAQKITSPMAVNGILKTTPVAINGKNGASPPKFVEVNGKVDSRDSLTDFDADYEEPLFDETSELATEITSELAPEITSEFATEIISGTNTTAVARPSRARRVLRAAGRVWGHVSPVQIFASAHENYSVDDAVLTSTTKQVEDTASEERIPELKTQSKEAKQADKKRSKEENKEERSSRRKKKQLSNLLKTVNKQNTKKMAGITSRSLTGLISALAEEAEGVSVRMDAREDTPVWRKQIDTVKIEFTRLGFKPLFMGGPDQLVAVAEENGPLKKTGKLLKEKLQEKIRRQPLKTQQQTAAQSDDDEDSCPVEYTLDDDGIPIGAISCADTAFQQIDVDNSGALDKDEIADALVLAATASSKQGKNSLAAAAAEVGEGSRKVIKQLARQLVDLYDTNDDGVIDREEYQSMVEDMAALRQVQKEREQQEEEKRNGSNTSGNWWNPFRYNEGDADEKDEQLVLDGKELSATAEMALQSQEPETTGKIVFENVKIDLRQLVFGALPIVKHITPGGPLFLEPLKVTVTASFTADDIMKSTLLDAGLRQLVSFALRVRVRSLRDLTDGAVFYGRKWKRDSVKAPKVECTELISVEIDDKDRAIITGRAKVRASEDAPMIEQSFKLRTKVATPRNGRAIKLSEPEIAIVLECPKQLEENINKTFAKMKMKPPPKPKPIYRYIPIHSPFKKDDDTGGYYMGEDNRLKSMYIKDKCLRFEMETILRPGRFLGSHYLAFTVPQRALIITVDRVKEGMRAARRRKKALKALQKEQDAETDRKAHHAEDALALDELDLTGAELASAPSGAEESSDTADENDGNDTGVKGFIARFVDGYVQAGAAEDSKEKLAHAISDWFGRQGISNSKSKKTRDAVAAIKSSQSGNEISRIVEDIALEQILDDDDSTKNK